jgi:predicted CoA-binding protein
MIKQPPIAPILQSARTIAVVGLSPKAHRDSYEVAHYMQSKGYRILPVNPVAAASQSAILGETCFATLADAAASLPAGQTIDIVDVFRNSADVPPVAQEAIAVGAKVLWLQLGITHEAACLEAERAGLTCVQDKCLLVEHSRWA